jgi:hypothetical protein
MEQVGKRRLAKVRRKLRVLPLEFAIPFAIKLRPVPRLQFLVKLLGAKDL